MYNIQHIKHDKEFLVIEWDIHNKCNLNCSYCEKQEDNNPEWGESGNFEHQKKIINIFNNYNNTKPLKIHFLGGEPTTYKYFYDLIDLIDHSLHLKVYSNNVLFIDQQNIRPIEIQFSFHASQISSERFINNLKKYSDFHNISVLVIADNYINQELINVIDFCKINNIYYEIYSPFNKYGEYYFIHEYEDPLIIKHNGELIGYKDLLNIKSKYGYICTKKMYFLDIYGNLKINNNSVNLLLNPDYLNQLDLNDHYCPNTNCYCPPDNYYKKRFATLKDKIINERK